MKTTVKILVLAQGAYAGITQSGTDATVHTVDVLLPAGKGARKGLEERAQEYREKAERYARYAAMCEAASTQV
jgi:uncharacterized protein with PhoU and TrkA domain